MGYISWIVVVAFWMWVIKKILDFDKRLKEIAQTLVEISGKLDQKN